ncbi:MAG: 5'/3'-nucleotidase SurE [Rhodobacteraceae bacterium]|nr:5'/3'-nucleotidase SurE [Paracoccaceae bacterium]
MRILITNDDGINAPGLAALHSIAQGIAGKNGEVWTVAPAFEQSGVAHCISYTKPMMITKFDAFRFAVEGAPADCVLAAIGDIMPARPDLVLSGVNRGNNAAENALYSGTIGAALEAALQGLPAIALSQFLGPKNKDIPDPFEAAAQHGAATIRALLERAPWENGADYRLFYNVNFPPIRGRDVRGQKITTQGYRKDTFFGTHPYTSPSGRKYLWITGGPQDVATEPGSDVAANLEGFVSITPMRADLTAHDVVENLRLDFDT